MKRQALLAAILLAFNCAASPAQITSSVVRIQVGDSVGSGAYLGDRLVLSCAHLFAGERQHAGGGHLPQWRAAHGPRRIGR